MDQVNLERSAKGRVDHSICQRDLELGLIETSSNIHIYYNLCDGELYAVLCATDVDVCVESLPLIQSVAA